jgi:hypothetical protein
MSQLAIMLSTRDLNVFAIGAKVLRDNANQVYIKSLTLAQVVAQALVPGEKGEKLRITIRTIGENAGLLQSPAFRLATQRVQDTRAAHLTAFASIQAATVATMRHSAPSDEAFLREHYVAAFEAIDRSIHRSADRLLETDRAARTLDDLKTFFASQVAKVAPDRERVAKLIQSAEVQYLAEATLSLFAMPEPGSDNGLSEGFQP